MSDNSFNLDRFIVELRARWDSGEPVDALGEFESSASIGKRDKSLLLELAYHEYRHRTKAGETIAIEKYCERFSTIRVSLQRRLEVHELLSANLSEWIDDDVCWPQEGDEFCRFELVKELGRGGVGRVYLAKQREMSDREVVIKVSASARREAQILGKLEHRNIVPVYYWDEDEESNLAAVCMPYRGCSTLADFIDEAFVESRPPDRFEALMERLVRRTGELAIPLESALRSSSYVEGVANLGMWLADALAHSHEKSIYHLDLKPSNVLLTASGRPMLLDFNLSMESDRESVLRGGTLPYMSPEQIGATIRGVDGSPDRNIDHRSDIFSLGVILYELLTGTHPCGGLKWDRPLTAVSADLCKGYLADTPEVEELNPEVPADLSQIVMKCLEYDRDRRYAAASQFRQKLSDYLDDRQKMRSRRKRIVAASVASVLVAICLVAGYVKAGADQRTAIHRRMESANDFVAQGRLAIANEQPMRAERLFGSAIDLDGRCFDALVARGQLRFELGRLHDAYDDFRRSHDVSPNALSLVGMLKCRAEQELFDEVSRIYAELVPYEFETAEVHRYMGFALCETGEYEAAESHFARAQTLDPTIKQLWSTRILNLFRASQRDGDGVPLAALEWIKKAREIDGDSANLFFLASQLVYRASLPEPERHRSTLEYIKDGKAHGLQLRTIKSGDQHYEFLELAEYRELLGLPPNESLP